MRPAKSRCLNIHCTQLDEYEVVGVEKSPVKDF